MFQVNQDGKINIERFQLIFSDSNGNDDENKNENENDNDDGDNDGEEDKMCNN